MGIEQKARELIADLDLIWHSLNDDNETNAAYERLKSFLDAQAQEEAQPLNEPFGNSEQLAEPVSTAYTLPEGRRWPFVESPGEFTERLAHAMQEFPLLGAVRHVLIENPPALAQQPAAPSGEAVAEVTSDDEGDMLIRALRPIPLGAKLYAAPQQPAAVDGMVMVQASDLKTLAEFADRGMRGNPAKLAALRAKAILAAQQQEGE